MVSELLKAFFLWTKIRFKRASHLTLGASLGVALVNKSPPCLENSCYCKQFRNQNGNRRSAEGARGRVA